MNRLARLFVDRPIVAIVLSLVLLLAGLLAMGRLPLTEYPNVMPTTVQVRAAYPGANPQVIADTVATPLETELTGLPGLQYMGSNASGDGRYLLTLTFGADVDPARAETDTQNRVARALPRLPAEVQKLGVVSESVAPDMLMVVHLTSPQGRYDLLHLSNFAQLQVRDALLRVPGVSKVVVWGAGDYSLRVWLDPDRMAARGLVAGDVVDAIRAQNLQVAAGSVGQQPDARSAHQLPLTVAGRLTSPEAFGDILLKSGPSGEQLRLKDVARVELGASSYSLRSLLDGKPAVGIQIVQDPAASAVEVAAAVRAEMAKLQHGFPQDIAHRIAYDPTLFVKASIANVVQTLAEAMVLVVLVVLLFLQSWRASLIPIAAVPVSLIGTLAVMHVAGFTLNTLSLFGLVLSIGIVVDDAIVVVENVERHLARGLKPREAALAAMKEVTGPILVITAVLAAVFVPTAFMGGLSGQFYQQFALTIAISTVLSAVNSLTLSPALAAMWLRPHAVGGHGVLQRFFGGFNRAFEHASERYGVLTRAGVQRGLRLGVLYAVLVAGAVWSFKTVPSGFVPAQDKYYLVGIVQLPPGASLDRTEAVTKQVTEIALAQPGVESVVAFPGISINGFVNSPNAAVVFTMLDPFERRKDKSLAAGAIAGALNGRFQTVDEGFVAMFPPPPVPGLGQAGGFKLQIQDRRQQGHEALNGALGAVMAAASKDPRLMGLFSGYQTGVPQLALNVDREKALAMGVPLEAIYQSLQVYLGSLYVNDFNFLGRAWQVNVQADAPFRADATALDRLWTRNAQGQMVPLTALVTSQPATGPDPVGRYNGFASADLSGMPAQGVSSGEAVAAMEAILAQHLPEGFGYEWTDLTYQQSKEGSGGLWVFPLAVGLAFLILAAAYGSWSLPLAVLAIVPTVILGALGGVWLAGGDNNLFTQVGLVVLVGLATKNAILIVEFARRRQLEGASAVDAVVEAARLRLRPILMTSLAFVMGVLPLVFASGAGAEMRHAVGVAVFAGMLVVTVAGLLFTPVFYVLLQRRRAIRAAALAACGTATPLQSPSPEVAPRFAQGQGLAPGHVAQPDWWAVFDDPVLDLLVRRGLEANLDLQQAAERVQHSRALAAGAQAERGPSGGVGLEARAQQLGRFEAPGTSADDRRSESVSAGVNLSWEVDLFGRLRHAAQAADARVQAVQADAAAMRLAVGAEIAQAWLALNGARTQAALARRVVDNRRATLDLVLRRVAAGYSAPLDEARARTDVAAAEAELPALDAALAISQHRLAVLLGASPSGFEAPQRADTAPRPVALRLPEPAQWAAQRPDLQAAEARLRALALDVESVRAEFLPRLSVAGVLGVVAGSVSGLGAAGAASWFVAPGVSLPVFDHARIDARLQAARAGEREALLAYRQRVLLATEEVESGLAQVRHGQQRIGALQERARQAVTAENLARKRFAAGGTDLLELLDAQRSAQQAEIGLSAAVTAQQQQVVALQRALGARFLPADRTSVSTRLASITAETDAQR